MVSPHHHSKHLHWHHISVAVPICLPPHSDLLHNAGNCKTIGYRVSVLLIQFPRIKKKIQKFWISSCSKSHCIFKIISEKMFLRDSYELFPGWYLGFASAPLSNRNLTASWLSLLQKKKEKTGYQSKFLHSNHPFIVVLSVEILQQLCIQCNLFC